MATVSYSRVRTTVCALYLFAQTTPRFFPRVCRTRVIHRRLSLTSDKSHRARCVEEKNSLVHFRTQRAVGEGKAGRLQGPPSPRATRGPLSPFSVPKKLEDTRADPIPQYLLTSRTLLTSTGVNVNQKKKSPEDKVFRNGCMINWVLRENLERNRWLIFEQQ